MEVKRSADTRIRREVVGQMLDYAANAVAYWPLESIRARFEAACDDQEDDPGRQVADFIRADPDDDSAVEAYWDGVKTNLRAGRIGMVFVADKIPSELRRIVEFLNAQMDPAEMLTVEISQYVGQGLTTLVPRVVGQTAEAQQAKGSGGSTRQWDEASFFSELGTRHGAIEIQVARRMLEWVRDKSLRVWWGKGVRSGSFVPVLDYGDQGHQLFAVFTYGKVEIYFQHYQAKLPFNSEAKRRKLLDKLNAIPGVSVPTDAIARRPSIPLSTFQDDAALSQLLEVYDWFLEQILVTQSNGTTEG